MHLLISIVGENNQGIPLQMGGLSGLTYDFHWSKQHGFYAYAPKSNVEIDDILAVNYACKNFPWRFTVRMVDGPVQPELYGEGGDTQQRHIAIAASIPPFVKPDLYRDYPAEDLCELARNCGLNPQCDPGDCVGLKRELGAYFVGRSWAGEERRQLEEKLKALSTPPTVPQPTPSAPEPEAPAAAVKVDRAAAARAARSRKCAARREAAKKELAPV